MDEWNKKLDIQLEILKKCQDDKKLSSCNFCDEILECKIRQEYVKAVYESMNKGKDGGFEF
jgi:hypothetical protein